MRANSEDYVLHGRFERCYIGVNAFLVNIGTGEIETVGSGQSYEQYLQDKYDVIDAAERKYVMTPSFDRTNKMELIRLRQEIGCSLQSALRLLSPEHCMWFTGKLRLLERAKDMFKAHGIETQVDLKPASGSAVEMKEEMWHWEAVRSALSERANSLS